MLTMAQEVDGNLCLTKIQQILIQQNISAAISQGHVCEYGVYSKVADSTLEKDYILYILY